MGGLSAYSLDRHNRRVSEGRGPMLTPMSERTAAGSSHAAARRPDIAGAIEEFVASNYSPSGIVAVARHGSVLAHQVWGEDGYTLDTPFRVASCTKSFTALALLILRRRRLMGLDDAVADHLPELIVDAPSDWPTLRVRHLLTMSAGLATDNPWGDRQESLSRDELSAWLAAGLRLVFPPGSSFEYSNLGYAILGEVITRLSGQDYREFVREHIIEPLGLTHTRFVADELDSAAPGYHREPALPGQPGGWSPQAASGPGAFSPIGGLYSSVRDLATWAQLYLSHEAPQEAEFTAADLLEAQQPLNHFYTGPAVSPLRGHVSQAYGHGLAIETYTDHGTVVAHSGGYPGFTAYMCWHKESGYTVIASANGTHSAVPGPARKVLLPLVAAAKDGSNGDEARQGEGSGSEAAARSPAVSKAPTWPETSAAVAKIEELVRQVPSTPAPELAARFAALFAENVELDFPLVRRIEYLRQALVNLGLLHAPDEAKEPKHDRSSCARWSLRAEYGRLELYIELAPVAPFGVQTFSAELVNGMSKVELF